MTNHCFNPFRMRCGRPGGQQAAPEATTERSRLRRGDKELARDSEGADQHVNATVTTKAGQPQKGQ